MAFRGRIACPMESSMNLLSFSKTENLMNRFCHFFFVKSMTKMKFWLNFGFNDNLLVLVLTDMCSDGGTVSTMMKERYVLPCSPLHGRPTTLVMVMYSLEMYKIYFKQMLIQLHYQLQTFRIACGNKQLHCSNAAANHEPAEHTSPPPTTFHDASRYILYQKMALRMRHLLERSM